MSMKNRMSVEVKPNVYGSRTGRVTLVLERLNARGNVYETINYTVERDEFERAMADAEVTVPWKALIDSGCLDVPTSADFADTDERTAP